MNKKILLVVLALFLCVPTVFAKDKTKNADTNMKNIGNVIKKEEYPASEHVAPVVNKQEQQETYVVEGSVEKNIDITLNECIRFALGNNPKIREAMEDIIASDARVRQAWSNWFPQLNWQTGYTRIKQLQLADLLGSGGARPYNYYVLGQISLSEMLYDFGVTQNKVTIQKLERDSYKINLTSTINTVIMNVKNDYYNLLYAYDRRDVAEDTVKKFEMFYNQAKAFYEIGTNPKVDVTIAEVNLSNAKLELIQANNAVDIAVAKLNNSIGLPFRTQYNVKERLQYYPVTVTLDDAIGIAEKSRPDLLILEKRVEAAKQNWKLAKKAYYPNISVEGQVAVGGKNPTSTYGYNLGGYLNFPTVNGMLIKNQIKEARAGYDREMARAESERNNIYLEIQQAYYTLDEKKSQIPVAFLNVKKAKENYDLSYGRYRVGVGNPTELKDAQVSYQNAQLSYYNTLYQYNSARAQLEKAIGRNLVDKDMVINLEK